jgi:hypothetical protein
MTTQPIRRPIATVRTLRPRPPVPAMPSRLFLEPDFAEGIPAAEDADDPGDDAA